MREILGIKMYDVKEVTKILGVTPQTTRAYIKQGKLKAVRIGKPWFISEEAIKFYITGGLSGSEETGLENNKKSVPTKKEK
jgi:excisionase family DNA binding protein